MFALLIEDVTLTKQREIIVPVRFRAGATTTLTVSRPLTAQQLRATNPDVRQQIDKLLEENTDAQVARVLNERGLHTGAGDAFDGVSVQWVRFSAKLPSLKERLLAAGILTTKQLSDRLGIQRSTIGRWRSQGLIEARICNEAGEWLYWLPKQKPAPREFPKNRPWASPLYEVQYERRSFAVDVETCPRCGGRTRLLAVVTDVTQVARFLHHRGEPSEPPARAPLRDPPFFKTLVVLRQHPTATSPQRELFEGQMRRNESSSLAKKCRQHGFRHPDRIGDPNVLKHPALAQCVDGRGAYPKPVGHFTDPQQPRRYVRWRRTTAQSLQHRCSKRRAKPCNS